MTARIRGFYSSDQLSVDQAADYLHLPTTEVAKMVARGDLPTVPGTIDQIPMDAVRQCLAREITAPQFHTNETEIRKHHPTMLMEPKIGGSERVVGWIVAALLIAITCAIGYTAWWIKAHA